MGVPTKEVGYTCATARRGDHESSYERVVVLEDDILKFSLGFNAHRRKNKLILIGVLHKGGSAY